MPLFRLRKPDLNPVHLILDFDGTITATDTLAALARVSPSGMTSWKSLGDAWTADHQRHSEQYRPAKQARRTLAEETAWLRSLWPVEDASARRVRQAGVFAQASREVLRRIASDCLADGTVQLRRGWERCFTEVEVTSVVSVNFSRAWVRTALETGADRLGARHRREVRNALREVGIWANEVEGVLAEGASKDRGEVLELRSSGDKLEAMKKARIGAEGKKCVYVGDSTTDLECLVEADVGIVMRDDELGSGQADLKETLERLEIRTEHISTLGKHAQDGTMLYWATNMEEIMDAIGKQ